MGLAPIEWSGTVRRGLGTVGGMQLFAVTHVGGAIPYRITTTLPLPEEERPWECASPAQAREMAAAMLARFVARVTAP
jgi:hypothetical protein